MKKTTFLLIAFLSTFVFAFCQSQKSPRVTAESTNIKVAYGQPSKRDREIFGKLVPYGQVWRTGANEATEITFQKDGTFGGKPVKAGTYTLFTIPGEKEWTVILNKQLQQFGAFEYEKHKGQNALEVKVPAKKAKSAVEKFTITPTDKALTIEWDTTSVSVPVKF